MNMSATNQQAIRSVITAQLDAFQADDGLQAFHYAAPVIRQQFKTVANFMGMVKTAYPAVYRPRSVIFGELTTLQGQPAQIVLLMAPSGNIVKAVYVMQQQPCGDWRIAGCFLGSLDDIGE
jgi:ketosteroid isomerase-like protein